jgi:hypothetical protein
VGYSVGAIAVSAWVDAAVALAVVGELVGVVAVGMSVGGSDLS